MVFKLECVPVLILAAVYGHSVIVNHMLINESDG